MISRRRSSTRNDQGVVAIELVLVMPFIIAVIVCIIALSGLFSTKSRVVGAARDGARVLSLRPGVTNADPNVADGIAVALEGSACQSFDPHGPPQSVTAKATKTYTVSIPFVGTWSNIAVTEKATMPCG